MGKAEVLGRFQNEMDEVKAFIESVLAGNWSEQDLKQEFKEREAKALDIVERRANTEKRLSDDYQSAQRKFNQGLCEQRDVDLAKAQYEQAKGQLKEAEILQQKLKLQRNTHFMS